MYFVIPAKAGIQENKHERENGFPACSRQAHQVRNDSCVVPGGNTRQQLNFSMFY